MGDVTMQTLKFMLENWFLFLIPALVYLAMAVLLQLTISILDFLTIVFAIIKNKFKKPVTPWVYMRNGKPYEEGP